MGDKMVSCTRRLGTEDNTDRDEGYTFKSRYTLDDCCLKHGSRIDDEDATAPTHGDFPMGEDCYLSLPSFKDYREIFDLRHYRSLPGDWIVIVADVAGSTQYIELGRYRDVNTVGAMPIAAVLNVIGDTFPFVFGGDGASLVVRPEQKDVAVNALLAVQRLVAKNYGMHLRVGCVTVASLRQKGTTVRVAKYEIAAGAVIAMFSGRGLALADEIIKNGNELEQTLESNNCEPNLKGLSCPWNKIRNENGCVLSLLVSTCPGVTDSEGLRIYRKVLDKLSKIMVLDEENNPVNMNLARLKKAGEILKDEQRMHEYRIGSLSWWMRAAEIRLGHMLFVLLTMIFEVPTYKRNIRINADYRKFDDMIRMVVDCSEDQFFLIQTFLEDLHRKGEICYGLHQSEHSLLTCLVENVQNGRHVHFVDGDAGGYTFAAKQLKSLEHSVKCRTRRQIQLLHVS
jgi:Protein of unknown function (DUF3095)